MGSTSGLNMPAAPRAESPRTTEDVERLKAEYMRRAQFRAADVVDPASAALARAASAGITTVLATPTGDGFGGQSALIATALPVDDPQIGALADPRKAALVLRTPVALHVTFSERPSGGNAYPNSLMGVIAFVRQTLLDAQHYGRAPAPAGSGVGYDPGSMHCSRRWPAGSRWRSRPTLQRRSSAPWTWRRRSRCNPSSRAARRSTSA